MPKSEPGSSRSASISSILSRTQGVMRQHLWIWPLVAMVILAFVGLWIRGRMEGAIKAQLAGNLKTILAANTEALRAWTGTMKAQAELFGDDDRVRELAGELLKVSQQNASPQAALL